jgi:nucleoside-diphosphate-sugar epimerase
VDVEDLAQIAIALAADDDLESDLRLDTAGDEVVEVGELARRIAAVLGHPDMSIERDFRPSAPADDYVGDGECLRKIAHAHGVPLRGLDDQIRRTADYLVGERTSGDS